MTASFSIRIACPADAAALAEFGARLFRETYGSDTAASDLDAYIRENFGTDLQAAEIDDRSAAVLLASTDDRILGYAHVIMNPADQGVAFLNRIYVDGEWRGSGLGRELLRAVIEESARRGMARLELTVFERNARAIAFYKRAGFTATGSTTFKVGDDLQTDIMMKMDLDAA